MKRGFEKREGGGRGLRKGFEKGEGGGGGGVEGWCVCVFGLFVCLCVWFVCLCVWLVGVLVGLMIGGWWLVDLLVAWSEWVFGKLRVSD